MPSSQPAVVRALITPNLQMRELKPRKAVPPEGRQPGGDGAGVGTQADPRAELLAILPRELFRKSAFLDVL